MAMATAMTHCRFMTINDVRIYGNYGENIPNDYLNPFLGERYWNLGELRAMLNDLCEASQHETNREIFLAITCISLIIANFFPFEQNPFRGKTLRDLDDVHQRKVAERIEIDNMHEYIFAFMFLCGSDKHNFWKEAWFMERQICQDIRVSEDDEDNEDDKDNESDWINHQNLLAETLKPFIEDVIVELSDDFDRNMDEQVVRIEFR